MSKDKAVEKGKILQVMEKYSNYFNEWNADVADRRDYGGIHCGEVLSCYAGY